MSPAENAGWRSYFWPGTEVLRNKLGIRDARELQAAERQFARQRLREPLPRAPATPSGYCAIHRHIFQDLYDWAGVYRTADMRHPSNGAFFCRVEFIADQMDQTFDRIRAVATGDLRATEPFAAALAVPLGDLNAIHPFREGNGRAMRALITLLAHECGLRFNQTRLDPDSWNEASRTSFVTADPAPLCAVLTRALSVPE